MKNEPVEIFHNFNYNHFMKTKRIEIGALLTAMFLLIVTFLSGTIPDPETPELSPQKENFQLDEWNRENGFPYFQIRAITQTIDGFLWIATNSQLIRFDGNSFVNIGAEAGLDILNGKMSDLLVDKKGNLWIGCTWGLITYPLKIERFIELSLSGGDDQNTPVPISRIIEGRNGSLWFGTHYNHLCHLENHKPVWYKAVKGLTSNTISALCERKDGSIWAGTPEGLFTLNTREEDFFHQIPLDTSGGEVPVTVVTSLHEDRNGLLWIGTNRGLMRIKDTNDVPVLYTTQNGLSHNIITKILGDSSGRLWIGTVGGLLRTTVDEDGNPGFDRHLGNIHILSLFEDKEQSLWIGSLNAGLKRMRHITPPAVSENMPGPLHFAPVIEKVTILQADGISITHHVGNCPGPAPTFKDEDDLTVFFTVPVFTKPKNIRFNYRLEGYDDQNRELGPGKERQVYYPYLPSGEYTFKITAVSTDGKENGKETAFSFYIEQSFNRSTAFKVIILTIFMMGCTAGLFLLKERFLKQGEKK